MGPSDGRQSASGSVVTAARAGAVLLVSATVALLVALSLPWWSLRMQLFQHRWLRVSPAFSGWGWLSFAAWLVALTMTLRFVVIAGPYGNRPHNRGAAWVIVTAGGTELLGNVMFIVSAPKTEVFASAGQFASYGAGLIIAIVAGVILVASGLLMLTPRVVQRLLFCPRARATPWRPRAGRRFATVMSTILRASLVRVPRTRKLAAAAS
jgi:hypothetical protein